MRRITGAVMLFLLGLGAAGAAGASPLLRAPAPLAARALATTPAATNTRAAPASVPAGSAIGNLLNGAGASLFPTTCPGSCVFIPPGETASAALLSHELQNQCNANPSTASPACLPALRINDSFTIKNELGPFKITTVNVPCALSVAPRPAKAPKTAPPYTCSPKKSKKTGKPIGCTSGITVSAGFDLGSKDVSALKKMHISPTQNSDLFNLLDPYLPPPKRIGCDAAIYLKEHPLSITPTQAQALDVLSFAKYKNDVIAAFHKKTGQNFFCCHRQRKPSYSIIIIGMETSTRLSNTSKLKTGLGWFHIYVLKNRATARKVIFIKDIKLRPIC